jgi:hypothetical protein
MSFTNAQRPNWGCLAALLVFVPTALIEMMFAGGACEGVPQPCRASHVLMWEILGALAVVSLLVATLVNAVIRWISNS